MNIGFCIWCLLFNVFCVLLLLFFKLPQLAYIHLVCDGFLALLWTYLVIITTLWVRNYCCPILCRTKQESERLSNLHCVIARIWIQTIRRNKANRQKSYILFPNFMGLSLYVLFFFFWSSFRQQQYQIFKKQ